MFLLPAMMTLAGCKSGVTNFSGDNSFQFLEKQCSFGPRNPGSEGYKSCRNYLIETLENFADTVFTQPFQVTVDKDTFNLVNIRYNITNKIRSYKTVRQIGQNK